MNHIKRIIVCSNKHADTLSRQEHMAFVKITDPNLRDDRVCPQEPAERISATELLLRFYDIDTTRMQNRPTEQDSEKERALLSRTARTYHALYFWFCIKKLIPHIDQIVISCDAGISRSKSVAFALCDALGLSRSIIKHSTLQDLIESEYLNQSVYQIFFETHRLMFQKVAGHERRAICRSHECKPQAERSKLISPHATTGRLSEFGVAPVC